MVARGAYKLNSYFPIWNFDESVTFSCPTLASFDKERCILIYQIASHSLSTFAQALPTEHALGFCLWCGT